MIDLSPVLDAAFDCISTYPALLEYVDVDRIEVAESVNKDASIAASGWIGIYRSSIRYVPYTLGKGANNWNAEFDLVISVQYADYHSARYAEDRLNLITNQVNRALIADKTLGGTVDRLLEINEEPSFSTDVEDSLYFQNRVITAKYERVPDE